MFSRTSVVVMACFFAFCDDAHAQKLRFGLLTGASLTDDYRPTIFNFPGGGGSYDLSNTSQAWMVGASTDFEFRKNLAVEVDAIRRKIQSSIHATYVGPDGTLITYLSPFTNDSYEWHFAVLGKYRFETSRTIKPFVEAGVTFLPQENRDRTGITSGAGVEIPFRRVSIAPTLRYTRFLTNPSLGAVQDQLQLVVGIRETSDSARPSILGRSLKVGFVAGGGLTKLFRDRKDPVSGVAQTSDHPTPIAGISIELPLHNRLSFEFNGLYRPTHDIHGTVLPDGSIRYQEGNGSATLSWQFPMFVKYRTSDSKVAPTFEIGPSFRLITHENAHDHSHVGATAGAGVTMRFGKVNVTPMLRYTRWGSSKDRFGREPYTAMHPNQVEAVVGFSF
jgi:hypothetical protein